MATIKQMQQYAKNRSAKEKQIYDVQRNFEKIKNTFGFVRLSSHTKIAFSPSCESTLELFPLGSVFVLFLS